MRPTTKKSAPQITTEIMALPLASLTHSIHVDADDHCPLCLADEVEAAATTRLTAQRQVDTADLIADGRLQGALARAALAKLDLADAIREGDVTVTLVERSHAFGLSIRYEATR